jgi:hypothetical protein
MDYTATNADVDSVEAGTNRARAGAGACRLLLRPEDTRHDFRGGCASADEDGFIWHGRHAHCSIDGQYSSPTSIRHSPGEPYAN